MPFPVVLAGVTLVVCGVCTSSITPPFVRNLVLGLGSQIFWTALLLFYIPAAWLSVLGIDR